MRALGTPRPSLTAGGGRARWLLSNVDSLPVCCEGGRNGGRADRGQLAWFPLPGSNLTGRRAGGRDGLGQPGARAGTGAAHSSASRGLLAPLPE